MHYKRITIHDGYHYGNCHIQSLVTHFMECICIYQGAKDLKCLKLIFKALKSLNFGQFFFI